MNLLLFIAKTEANAKKDVIIHSFFNQIFIFLQNIDKTDFWKYNKDKSTNRLLPRSPNGQQGKLAWQKTDPDRIHGARSRSEM